MSNTYRSADRNRRPAQQVKQAQKGKFMLLAALSLIVGGVGALIWMSVQTAAPKTTTNSYGAPALAQQGGTVTDFSIASLAGGSIALSDFAGEVVIMNFWATWCPPCRAEMPGLNRFYETYRDKGLILLAINEEESIETVRPFIQNNNFTFPVLLDEEGRVALQYSTRSFPTTFIIDREGVIQHVQTGIISEDELARIVLPLLQ